MILDDAFLPVKLCPTCKEPKNDISYCSDTFHALTLLEEIDGARVNQQLQRPVSQVENRKALL
jgi:hypothetical protein